MRFLWHSSKVNIVIILVKLFGGPGIMLLVVKSIWHLERTWAWVPNITWCFTTICSSHFQRISHPLRSHSMHAVHIYSSRESTHKIINSKNKIGGGTCDGSESKGACKKWAIPRRREPTPEPSSGLLHAHPPSIMWARLETIIPFLNVGTKDIAQWYVLLS